MNLGVMKPQLHHFLRLFRGYRPSDEFNFLKHWEHGRPKPGGRLQNAIESSGTENRGCWGAMGG